MGFFEQLSLFRLPNAGTESRVRHIQIGSRVVTYELRQAAGRRLAMTIDERGLRVGAPRNLALRAIEDFVRENGDWVLRKLDEYVARHTPRHIVVRDGTLLPMLGRDVVVRVVAGGNRGHWNGDELILAVRPGADLDALARRAVQRRALEHFRTRVVHFAARLHLPVPPVALSSARTRWGSCSARTGIRLNWRLVHLPPEFADYVVAHELAHLIEMNHSAKFWKVVAGVFPEWRSIRDELKSRAGQIPLL